MKKSMHTVFFMFLSLLFLVQSPAQDTVYVTDYFSGGAEGSLNAAINANIDSLSSKIFKLQTYGCYVLTSTITVPAGETLTIVADKPGETQETCPPQILWTSSDSVATRFNFDCYGKIVLKNIWLCYMNISGNQVGSSLQMNDDSTTGQSIGDFDNVIFDYAPCPNNTSGAVGVTATHAKLSFKNCYFRNCIDVHLRYYGRAVSFPYNTPGYHIDSLSFENCSFANLGYVLMQEQADYADYVKFNHCTFMNTIGFALESGWWYKLAVTNCIFVNQYMYGDIESMRGGAEEPNGGTFTIDSIASFPFTPAWTENDRRILFTNSSYHIEQWLIDYMNSNPYSDNCSAENKPHPQPMMNEHTRIMFDTIIDGTKLHPYFTKRDLYDGANPNFYSPPTDTVQIKDYLFKKWDNSQDCNWAYQPASTINSQWPLPENMNYTNVTLQSAGMCGFPLGDLRWQSSTMQTQWAEQAESENAYISQWLETGTTGVRTIPGSSIPSEIQLSQNYPNPFNPTTEIKYSITQRSHVTLKVYNVLGKEAATLQNGVQPAGNYITTFNAKDLASGVYFYRLQIGSGSLTKKLVLMK